MFNVLTDILPHYAAHRPDRLCVRFYKKSTVSGAYTYAETWDWVQRWARLFIDRGLQPGHKVIIALPNTYDFVGAYFGALHIGAVPAAVPPIRDLSAGNAYLRTVAERIHFIHARALVIQEDQESLRGQAPFSTMDDLAVLSRGCLPPAGEPPTHQARPDDLAMLQFTSGTAGKSKAVQLTHGALIAQTKGIARRLRVVTEEDWAVSWLPLFHDMGLIGYLLTTMLVGGHVSLLLVEDFIRRPRIWLQVLSDTKASITGAPPSAFALAARHLSPEKAAAFDLSRVRIALVGAEMVTAAPLEQFAQALAPAGFRPTSFIPTYGLAENCLAVNMTPLDTGPEYDTVYLDLLQDQGLAQPVETTGDGERPRRTFTSLGPPLPDTEVAIEGEKGEHLGERRVGEIIVRSTSLLTGYFDNPDATQEVLQDGWMHTGDLGYLAGGNLYITGRKKEVMIVGGRNYYPDDLEQIAAEVPGVYRRRTVAIAHEDATRGTDVIVILAETKLRDVNQLRMQIRRAVLAAGYPVSEVVLLPPKTVQMTANGKLKRTDIKRRYLAGELNNGIEIS